MAYTYGMRSTAVVSGSLPGLPRRGATRGELSWGITGLYFIVVPEGVTSICAVTVAGGGGGWSNVNTGNNEISSGGAGGLAWKNNIPVSPGQVLTIVVGAGGIPGLDGNVAGPGGTSSVITPSLGVACSATGGGAGAVGIIAAGGTIVTGDGGGTGGTGARLVGANTAASGGGAAGYSGNGGNGVAISGILSGNPGTGGGAGSGSVLTFRQVLASGGVGLFGEGASGAASQGGSGGQSPGGSLSTDLARAAGLYGAGGQCWLNQTGNTQGAMGGVRIIWGSNRFFPSTNVGQP